MKQFDLFKNTDPDSKKYYPYFLAVQTDLLDELTTRVVLPMAHVKDAKEYPSNLCPVFEINNKSYALMTHQITTVSSTFLEKKEGSLLLSRDDVISALDFLLTGI